MGTRFSNRVVKFIHYFEYVIAVLLVIALFVALVRLGFRLYEGVLNSSANPSWLSEFLGHLFSVVIGLEFLKMLVRQTSGSVMEVVLFSIARQMIVEHTPPLENLICVLAITILFVTRKYFYVSKFDVAYNGQDGKDAKKVEEKTADGASAAEPRSE